jgi:hypothetical protein
VRIGLFYACSSGGQFTFDRQAFMKLPTAELRWVDSVLISGIDPRVQLVGSRHLARVS